MVGSDSGLWPENVSATKFLVTGAMLEFIGNGILYPFYFCKTHLQTNTNPLSSHGNPFVHLIKQAQHITEQNGVRGLYRGYLWSTLGTFPGIILHIAAYTMAKHKLSYNELDSSHSLFSSSTADSYMQLEDHPGYMNSHSHNNTNESSSTPSSQQLIPQSLIPLVSGLLAESAAVLAYVPQEVVAQRLQLSPRGVKLFDIIKEVYQENGVRSFWRGTYAAYASYLPGSAIWWGCYEGYKNVICKERHRRNLFGYSAAGILGGLTTAVLTNPIDIIRTRIQTQKGTYGAHKIVPVICNVYKHEGMLGFSKGVGARIGLLVLEGILFADFYEIMMYFSQKS